MITRRKFRTKKAQKRERLRLAVFGSLYGVGALLLLAGITYGIHHPSLRITEYTFTTDGKLSEQALATVYDTALSDSVWGIIPRDSTIFLSTKKLQEKAQQALPRIASIETKRTSITSIHTTVTERLPHALWCGDIVPPFSASDTSDTATYQGSCYLLDPGGYVYDQAPSYSGNPFPRYYGSLEEAEPVGQHIVAEEEFAQWQQLYAKLAEEANEPRAILFADERDVELYLKNGLRVIVPRTQDIHTTFDRLTATLSSDSIDMTRPIAYLDMRFGTKAYIRYADTHEDEVEEEEEEVGTE